MNKKPNIAVTGESPMDLAKSILEEEGIATVPFHIAFDEADHLDGTFKNEEMYDYFERTNKVPQSGCPSIGEYKALFEKSLESHDSVLHFSMSSSLSAGYQNAVLAAQEFEEGKVTVVDSRLISLGIAFLALKAKELIRSGVDSVKELREKASALVEKVHASLIIDKLDYMHRGGRCGKITLLAANILRLKPVIECVDGKLEVGAKYRGKREKCLRDFITHEIRNFPDCDKSLALVGFTSSDDQEGERIARETLLGLGFKKVLTTLCNSTNAVHSGPLTVGFAFMKA